MHTFTKYLINFFLDIIDGGRQLNGFPLLLMQHFYRDKDVIIITQASLAAYETMIIALNNIRKCTVVSRVSAHRCLNITSNFGPHGHLPGIKIPYVCIEVATVVP